MTDFLKKLDKYELEQIVFDKRIAFGYGLTTGLFIGFLIGRTL